MCFFKALCGWMGIGVFVKELIAERESGVCVKESVGGGMGGTV